MRIEKKDKIRMKGITLTEVMVSLMIICMFTLAMLNLQQHLRDRTEPLEREMAMKQVQEEVIDEFKENVRGNLVVYYDEQSEEFTRWIGEHEVDVRTRVVSGTVANGGRLHKIRVQTAIGNVGSQVEVYVYER